MTTAVVLAAGLSRRMGKVKMALPWGDTTVLGRVLFVLKAAGVDDILVVTGAAREVVEDICGEGGVRTAANPDFERGEMLSSLQTGLRAAPTTAQAALVVLGDQPGIQAQVVAAVLQGHLRSVAPIVVPSYQHRRGHPWLLARELWPAMLEMQPPDTPRDFLNRHSNEILYVETDTASILEDVDTPEEYLKFKP